MDTLTTLEKVYNTDILVREMVGLDVEDLQDDKHATWQTRHMANT